MDNMIVLKDANGQYQAFDRDELLNQMGGMSLDGGLILSDAIYVAGKVGVYMAIEDINRGDEYGYSHYIDSVKEPNIIWPDGVTYAVLVGSELIFAESGNYIRCLDHHSSMDSGPTSWSIEEMKPSNNHHDDRVRTICHNRNAPIFSRTIKQ